MTMAKTCEEKSFIKGSNFASVVCKASKATKAVKAVPMPVLLLLLLSGAVQRSSALPDIVKIGESKLCTYLAGKTTGCKLSL